MTTASDSTVPRLLLTPVEAAAALGISRTRIFALLAGGAIESVQVGRSRRIPVSALEEFVARLRAGSTTRRPVESDDTSQPPRCSPITA